MKTQHNNSGTQIEKTMVDTMFQEVKETVATNMTTSNHKSILSSADLWNIQRNLRTRTGRRYFI